MNHYESEYQKQKQQKNASFKKIEDEYSAMKAALLSSMDEEDVSDEDGFPNQDPNVQKLKSFENASSQESDPKPLNSMSGQPKVTPSIVKSSLGSIEEDVSLCNSHGNIHYLVLDFRLKLVSSNADYNKHEDVLVRNSSSRGSTSVHSSGSNSVLMVVDGGLQV